MDIRLTVRLTTDYGARWPVGREANSGLKCPRFDIMGLKLPTALVNTENAPESDPASA